MKKFFIIVGLLSNVSILYGSDDTEALIRYHCGKDVLTYTRFFNESKKRGNFSEICTDAKKLDATFQRCPDDIPHQANEAFGLAISQPNKSKALYDAMHALTTPIILAIEASSYANKEGK